MAKKSGLSAEDVDNLRAQLASGGQPLVWFTAAAVGMDAGKSAKVLAFTEPEEGDFIQVRPTGSKDEISFSPAELTSVKPPPARKKAPAVAPEPAPKETVIEYPYVPPEAPVKATPPKPAPAAAAPAPAPAKPARKSSAKTPEVTVTLVSTADGEWTVEALQGTRKVVRPVAVPAGAVAQAAKLIHPEVSEIVEGVLNAARTQQLAKVEQLRAELEAAQRALEDLGA